MGLFLFALASANWLGAAEDPPSQSAAGATAAAQETIPVRDFFRPPFLNFPQVNRAGSWLIASVDTEDDHRAAVFLNLKTGKSQSIRGPSDRDIDELYWLDNRRVLMSQSREKLYADALYVTDVEDLSHNYAVERHSAVDVISVPLHSPLKPIIWIKKDAYHEGFDGGSVQIDASRTIDQSADRNAIMSDMMRSVEETSGTAARIIRSFPPLPGKGLTESYLADREGELAYALAMEKGLEHLYVLQKSKWLQSPLDLDRYEVIGAGDAAGEVLAVGPRQEGKPRALLRINAVSGEVIATLYQDEQYDAFVEHVFRHPTSRAVIGIQLYRKTLETVWFDPAHAELQSQLNKLFPGKAVSIIGSDLEEKMLVVATFSDRAPVAYSLVDLGQGELKGIADSAPWIPAKRMRPMQHLHYKTRDGFKVEGYLTMPEGATKENPAPLVVLVHGGPWARDTWGWDPEVQFLASRGYAVFQPNYRGSTGYSWSFPQGDDWNYRKMHEDVTDGARQLIKSGLVDARRIAIMGTSFGGYLAMCGAAFEPDLYRCAITQAGWFDLALRMKEAKRNQYESIRYQYFLRNLGDPEKQKTLAAEISPITQVDQVKIPVLVAHGKSDSVVDVEQSERLVKELKRYNVPHKALLKGGEGHGLSRLDNRVEFYTAVETFLAENMRKP